MFVTDRTVTSSEPAALDAPTAHAASRRGDGGVHDVVELPVGVDSQLRPVLDTSDDPTGAAIVWPLLMLVTYAVLGLGFVLAR